MTKPSSIKLIAGLTLLSAATVGCKDEGGGGPLSSQLGFDEERSEVVVILNRDVGGGEKVHARVRSLAEGDALDCGAMVGAIPKFGARGDGVYGGEAVTEDQFVPPSSPGALLGETPEELQVRMEGTYFVDVCVEKDGEILHEARYSLNQALDRVGANGKFDANDDGVRIVSNQAYAEACEAELGPNPLFKPVLDANGDAVPGDYIAANCLDGVPIETNIDGEPQDRAVDQCDDPQYIYSHCEPDARTGTNGPRVQTARNEKGSDWVLLCRKSLNEEGWYNDIAMIGHNPNTGKTCFFQNQLRGSNSNMTPDSNGIEVPWPGDNVVSAESPRQGNQLWGSKPEGGSNDGIACSGCHDADPWIHSPWIDTAKRADGTPIVPKIGIHDNYVEGYNRPYSLVDQEDQGWTIPRRLVSEEAAACTKCHSMNAGQWLSPTSRRASSDEFGEGCNFCNSGPWINRLTGEDDAWARLITDSHQGFEDVFWMPPNASEVLTEDTWADSEFAAAVKFMVGCGQNPTDPACIWEAAPTVPGDNTELPEVDLTGTALARAAVAAIGGKYNDENGSVIEQTARCTDCHAVTRFGVSEWRTRTQDAVRAGIDLRQDFDELSQAQAMDLVNYMRKDSDNPESVFAPYKIGVFSALAQFPYFRKLFEKAFSGGAGGGTLHVVEQEVTAIVARDEINNHSATLGAGEWTFTLSHDEARPGGDADVYVQKGSAPTLEMYECRPWLGGSEETCTLSLDAPTEVHWMVHGYGESNAYHLVVEGDVVGGEGADPAVEYAQFLARVQMPKGSHPPFSALEAATVAKWFVDEDIANLTAVMPEAARPETCADAIAYSGLAASGMPTDDTWFTDHLDDMALEGWHARNVEKGINMYQCGGTDGTDCFASASESGFATNEIDGARVVKIRDLGFDTSFWMRSSADGRFVGNGGRASGANFGATITDLVADRNIGVRGSYDPGFFPNNDGFIMQGSGAGLCGQSVLTTESSIADGIDFTEPGCSNAQNVALYQHVAVDLDGGDYFIINAQFTSDPGSGSADPRAPFGEDSQMRFHPLVFDGTAWDQKETLNVRSPYEGDSVMSPSGRMVISRFAGPGGNALGYSLRRINATPAGSSYNINIDQPVRFVCAPGAKANISFDERFSITHHYEGGTANLYLTDLLTLQSYKLTDMPANTRALFPHFRSDGWIYFLAQGPDGDVAMATDAAVVLSNL